MNKHKCLTCDEIIAEEDLTTKNGAPVTLPIMDNSAICPYCGSNDLVAVIQCSQCDEYVFEDALNSDELCPICQDEQEVEVEFCITINITYRGKFSRKHIREHSITDDDNPLATKAIHEEVRNQVAAGNYCITNYTWEETDE